MKKFYETPAVEFTGFSAEDVITTSITTVNMTEEDLNTFNASVAAQNTNGTTTKAIEYGSYTW